MFGLHRNDGTVSRFEARVVQQSVWVDQAVHACFVTLRAILEEQDHASFGISGGSTPTPVFDRLADAELPWDRITFVQVDERCAPLGDPARNLTAQRATLGRTEAAWLALPVGDDGSEPDEDALSRYEAALTELTGGAGLDLVQLGLGVDGHTASLLPGDAVLEVEDKVVDLTAEPYEGYRRVTLTIPALEASHRVMWLVTDIEGAKADAYQRLRTGDPSIPAGRLDLFDSLIIAAR